MNLWWQLYDSNMNRYYYYNMNLHKTVWNKPNEPDCQIIKLQVIEIKKVFFK